MRTNFIFIDIDIDIIKIQQVEFFSASAIIIMKSTYKCNLSTTIAIDFRHGPLG